MSSRTQSCYACLYFILVVFRGRLERRYGNLELLEVLLEAERGLESLRSQRGSYVIYTGYNVLLYLMSTCA